MLIIMFELLLGQSNGILTIVIISINPIYYVEVFENFHCFRMFLMIFFRKWVGRKYSHQFKR